MIITIEDRLFSELTRLKAYQDREATCEKCGRVYVDTVKDNGDPYPGWRYLETSHFYGRANHSVRYDSDNAAALCPDCHRHFEANRYEHEDWFKKRLGDRFDQLTDRLNSQVKIDKAAIRQLLRNQIKEVTNERLEQKGNDTGDIGHLTYGRKRAFLWWKP